MPSLEERIADWDTDGAMVKITARNTLLRRFGGGVTWADVEAWCFRPGNGRHMGVSALRAYLHGIGPKAAEAIGTEIQSRGGRTQYLSVVHSEEPPDE